MRYPDLVPKWVCKTPVTVTVYAEGLDEDGAPVQSAVYEGFCNYQDGGKTSFEQYEKKVDVKGTVLFHGDIFPELSNITDGVVTVFGEERQIVEGRKNRNPDGSVNYTEIWLA